MADAELLHTFMLSDEAPEDVSPFHSQLLLLGLTFANSMLQATVDESAPADGKRSWDHMAAGTAQVCPAHAFPFLCLALCCDFKPWNLNPQSRLLAGNSKSFGTFQKQNEYNTSRSLGIFREGIPCCSCMCVLPQSHFSLCLPWDTVSLPKH